MNRTRVLIVDDSALVRSLLRAIIEAQPDLDCVGAAGDPYAAREMIRTLDPDVLTLDVEMPRMDGIDFLEKLMRLRPMPVLMISTLTERGAETTLRALELGAVDFVSKPRIGVAQGLQAAGAEIIEKIRMAANVRVTRGGAAGVASLASRGPATATSTSTSTGTPTPTTQAPAAMAASGAGDALVLAPRRARDRVGTERVVAIGASTGGTEAIRAVLTRLPADFPAIVITQHMPEGFTRSFAQRLDGLCRIRVSEARGGERLLAGNAYIAPGGHHMVVERSGANYRIAISDADPVNRHRPSVDVMFDSVASSVGPNAIGVILTGMGRDGAAAMRRMRDAGAWNIAQDEASCVVYGMPREALLAGAIDDSVALEAIASRLIERAKSLGTELYRV